MDNPSNVVKDSSNLPSGAAKPPSIYLDSAERLALCIIGDLAVRGHLNHIIVNTDNTGLTWLYEDIANTIRNRLPDLDETEMIRMMHGNNP